MSERRPMVLEAEAGRDIILTIDGKPVFVLEADAHPRQYSIYKDGQTESYTVPAWVARGIEARFSSDPAYFGGRYFSNASTSLNLVVVGDVTTESVLARLDREGR